jgi:hypothetical protein
MFACGIMSLSFALGGGLVEAWQKYGFLSDKEQPKRPYPKLWGCYCQNVLSVLPHLIFVQSDSWARYTKNPIIAPKKAILPPTLNEPEIKYPITVIVISPENCHVMAFTSSLLLLSIFFLLR